MNPGDFQAFFEERARAAEDYVNGGFERLERLLPAQGDASFHSPRGDSVRGAAEVARRYRADADSFLPGGTTEIEILHQAVEGDLAFWTGFQVASVRLKGAADAVAMRIRVTEVFRRIDGSWKLVHRHADMPADRT